MRPRTRARHALSLLAAAIVAGCANAVTTPPPIITLIFRITVGRQLVQSQDVRYVFAIDTNGDPNDGPKPYGPWPQEKPITGWDLPFYVTDQTQGVDLVIRNPPVEPGNAWTHMFALSFLGTQPIFQQWEQILDPATKKRLRIEQRQNLVQGQDFRLVNSATPVSAPGTPTGPGAGPIDTIELTLVLDRFLTAKQVLELKQFEANLVTQVRPPETAAGGDVTGWKLDQWFSTSNVYFTVSLNPDAPPERREALDGVPQFPQNIPPGMTQDDVTFRSYSSEVKKQGT